MSRRNLMLRSGLCFAVAALVTKVALAWCLSSETGAVVQEWLATVERELVTVKHVLIVVRPYLMQALLGR